MDDDFNDWEPIQLPTLQPHPSSTHRSAPPPEPDTVHEGLEMSSADEAEVNSSVASNNGVEAEPNHHAGPLKRANEIGRILRNGVVHVAARVRCCLGLGFGLWPFGAIGGALAALLVWFVRARMRKWRARVKEENKDRLIVLVQEKDQKINQLLFQIADMTEIISARRRVPVLREKQKIGSSNLLLLVEFDFDALSVLGGASGLLLHPPPVCHQII
ncbi:hypothetical protein V6N13_099283 [Hibiscus sabdariffa]|uniref:Transmembrane protein n=1 Tax=Hibiscus sabdariffa TaxID=183260 RepID=A0ABR2PZ81_9ROSI